MSEPVAQYWHIYMYKVLVNFIKHKIPNVLGLLLIEFCLMSHLHVAKFCAVAATQFTRLYGKVHSTTPMQGNNYKGYLPNLFAVSV